MAGYNLTSIAENGTSILGFTQGVNEVLMFGWLGVILLIGIAIVAFTSFNYLTRNTARAFVATAYLTFLMSLFLRAMDLLPNNALFLTLIFCGAVIAVSWVNAD